MHFKSGFFLAFIILLGILFSMPAWIFGQDPSFNRFSVEEGLPSNDVYDVLVSSDGLLWFATDNGVSRYDGNEFVNFNIEDGLPTASVLKFYEDLFGRIWFMAYNGMLSYLENGEITPYKYNDSIVKYFADNYFGKIQVDSLGTLLLSPRSGGKGVIDADGNVYTRSALIPNVSVDSCFLFFEDKGDDYFITIQTLIPDECMQEEGLFYCGDSYYVKQRFTQREFQRNYLKTGQNEYIVSYRNLVYVIRNHKIVKRHKFEEEVLSIYEDHKGKLWISVKYDHGIYIFENSTLLGKPDHFLEGITVTNMVQDREDDYWLSTEGHGVLFAPGFDFSLYTIPGDDGNLNVMALAVSGNRLWFTTREKEIYSGKVSQGKIDNIRKLEIEEPFNWIQQVLVDKDGYLWLSSTQHLRYDPAGFPVPLETTENHSFLNISAGDTVISATSKLAIYYDGKLINVINPDIERRIYSAYQLKGDIWLGTLYGLYAYRDDQFLSMAEISSVLSERISCISKIDDILVIGTAAHGLAFIRGDSLVYTISEEDGLIDNAIKSIFAQNDTILWVGTKNGLNKITLHKKGSRYSTESYGQGDGIPSKEINAITMHEEHIWLATSNGLVSFDPYVLEPHNIPPIIQINNVQINGRDTILLDEYVLDYDQNDLRIDFSGISFRREGDLKYRYMMSTYIDERIETKNNWVNFPNMLPGEYSFNVNVGNNHGIWNESPRTIRFIIKKHYTQTAWFMVLLVVLSSIVLFGITMFLQKQRKIKEQARRKLAEVEQKMFRLQMNPHFVFNALLAIQGFMYQKNTHEAGRYLTSFAKLIRHTLYGSTEETIPLDKEIEAMQYYLELQRLRFNDNFEFNIEIGEDIISETIKLPPLLIQPFLENAIEHGLQHKKENGNLRLSFKQGHHFLIIEIKDDGVGREKAIEIQKKRGKLHKSMGMEIVRQRIDSLNKITGKNISLEIVDLKDKKQKGAGTLVKIFIPL